MCEQTKQAPPVAPAGWQISEAMVDAAVQGMIKLDPVVMRLLSMSDIYDLARAALSAAAALVPPAPMRRPSAQQILRALCETSEHGACICADGDVAIARLGCRRRHEHMRAVLALFPAPPAPADVAALVAELRDLSVEYCEPAHRGADMLTALAADNARLKRALQKIADYSDDNAAQPVMMARAVLEAME